MSGVRVLVGTRKGAFVLTADGTREELGRQPARCSRAGRSTTSPGRRPTPTGSTRRSRRGWFGQLIQRSDDGGATWEQVGNRFEYDGVPGTHQWYDGTPHPWEFARVWHLEPSPTDPDTVYAGVEDAALFRSADGGKEWQELPGLRGHGSGPNWQPGAGGMCLHTILLDPADPQRMFVAISAAGAFRTDDGGDDAGGRSTAACGRRASRTRTPRSATACTASRCTRPGRRCCSCRSTGTSCAATTPASRGTRSAATCPATSASRSRSTPHEPDTVYVVPITSDSQHFPPDGRLRVYRSRTGGNEWEPLTEGLPQSNCYVNVLRDAMAVDSLDRAGVYFGTTGGQVYASADAGDSWAPIVRDLPAVLSVEVQTLP